MGKQVTIYQMIENNQTAIVILNWMYWEQTIKCLEYIISSNTNMLALIVIVENGSQNNSDTALREYLNTNFSSEDQRIFKSNENYKLIYCSLPINTGYAGGMNAGSIVALDYGVDHILILNNDAYVGSDTIHKLVNVSKKYQNALVGPVVYDSSNKDVITSCGRPWPQLLFGRPNNKVVDTKLPYETGYIEGSILLLSKEFARKRLLIDGYIFDQKYFLYYEDVDICRRAYQFGFRCLIDPASRALHIGSFSSGGIGNDRSRYYMTRNRIYIVNKFFPKLLKYLFHFVFLITRILPYTFRMFSKSGRRTNKIVLAALIDGYSNKFGYKDISRI